MRNWPAALETELQSETYRPFHLIEFDFDTPLRYTNCDIPLVLAGDLYSSRGFNIPEISHAITDNTDKITIEIDIADRDASLLDEFVGGTPSDTTTKIFLQVLDDDMVAIATTTIFQGKIDSYQKKGTSLTVTIASFHSLWNKDTMERSSASCRRNFKQADCGYAGDVSECDRSWNTCVALNNTDRFNGFRFLPDLEDKEIWWGREFKHDIPTK